MSPSHGPPKPKPAAAAGMPGRLQPSTAGVGLSSLSSPSSSSRPRSSTSSGAPLLLAGTASLDDPFRAIPNHPRKTSLGRKGFVDSLTGQSPQNRQQPPHQSIFKGLRRRTNSTSSLLAGHGAAGSQDTHIYAITSFAPATFRPVNWGCSNPEPIVVDSRSPAPPPDPLGPPGPATPTPSAARAPMDSPGSYIQTSSTRVLSRAGAMPVHSFPAAAATAMMPSSSTGGSQIESNVVHQHISDTANKRISTLEYLRKAHEGRVYWFNTILFDRPDLVRMPYFDSRRLARRATNYLLLGLSLPTVIDLNSSSPIEFLRALNVLLSEFDSFQQLHSDSGSTATLSRARIPHMFRRATPSAKSRRSSSSTNTDILYDLPSDGTIGAAGIVAGASSTSGPLPSPSGATAGGVTIGNGLGGSASVVSFGQSETDLLAGEEYVHLLTPSLPFDPDFFETFATLCDVLIDTYTRLLSLLPSPRDCHAAVGELFTRADTRVRKIILQGIVKEFEDMSRSGARTEVASVGKIVLGGLM